MSIVAFSITYSPTILVGLCVKSALGERSLHILQFSSIMLKREQDLFA